MWAVVRHALGHGFAIRTRRRAGRLDQPRRIQQRAELRRRRDVRGRNVMLRRRLACDRYVLLDLHRGQGALDPGLVDKVLRPLLHAMTVTARVTSSHDRAIRRPPMSPPAQTGAVRQRM